VALSAAAELGDTLASIEDGGLAIYTIAASQTF
jgi:hypothetical protein